MENCPTVRKDNSANSRRFDERQENLSLRRTVWWAREDSNLQPSGYEPLALTIELRALLSTCDLIHV